MAKGDARGNLRNTRNQINNAATSAQARAFKARQITLQKRAAEERKLRAAIAARAAAGAKPAPEPEPAANPSEPTEPTKPTDTPDK